MQTNSSPPSGRVITNLLLLLILAALLTSYARAQSAPAATQALAGSGFTYQGQLKNAGGGVTGTCDFEFSLWDAASDGAQVGATQTVAAGSVQGGLFTENYLDLRFRRVTQHMTPGETEHMLRDKCLTA